MRNISFLAANCLLISSLSSLEIPSALPVEQNATIDRGPMTSAIKQTQSVFGENLFNGNFTKVSQHIYNPDYILAIGDIVNIKMWGAFEYEAQLVIDSQGNIFLPKVGVIKLLGVKNSDLVSIITKNIKRVFKNNVYIYADMGIYQNVSVFVTGNVNNPGLYQGLSSDSLIQYIDKANGINPSYGSYRKIVVLRDNLPFKQIDLYDFILNGKMETFAFRNGDVILVKSIGSYANATGEVLRPYRFEFKTNTINLEEFAQMSGVKPTATNAVVKKYTADNEMIINSYPKSYFKNVELHSGDSVEFIPDHSASMIQVNIEGEHNGLHTIIVPKGTTLSDMMKSIKFTSESNKNAIQIYRKSTAQMQKNLINAQLKELETLALTSSSATPQEANMRASEAKSVLEFIERAKKVEPKGQVVLSDDYSYNEVVLQDSDMLYIPTKDNLVIVQGEVALPGAFTYMKDAKIDKYLEMAGDLNQRANKERIIVINANGKASKYDASAFSFSSRPDIQSGDSILVLPKVEGKTLQITGAITQILYQIAIATKVVLDI
ncbi:capsular polysaccharide ABC transporter%2C periplasmic polysaccharide-binding protein [Campylobacter hyointestinalis subsp. hyointestinalis]|uniref:Capsular polysaccharide ABC transporter, periplasmic polysaccharide-binding protein n=1 Tax=Campylobacter hyointestinalis subsp. hyointestinalis TaxID=91352 RepID=A0A9W5AUQ3_CAMHY|nr:polysaccharide biosynthesis/export family protein [Campylobacter hyointestinalis]CUU70480.1 capsular polysaccharide ABC transporter%2C periplasmic polysaccharide-binding protein [Campylobacter hyointestinalis subsp. hyointestinalis]CUU70481.1 capsular polysaccharide ABC transporter%2C periplasmic polysaccharide-binding protein [Campylobacter hyointestinalis subsp. hyointestinalis]CUU85731.1 capsular polysaccharide ABC transporter%2C periplasmic polysaccharide-binding protein [Campylobacter hy